MAKQRDKSPEPTLITVQRPSRQQDSSTSSGSGSESSDDEYVVEALLKRRVGVDGDYEIMVKWEGYDGTDEATTWEPEENITGCPNMLNLFMENDGKRAVWRKDVVSPSKSKGKSKSKTINLTSSDDDEEDVLAPKPKSKGAAAQAAKKARPAPEEKRPVPRKKPRLVRSDSSEEEVPRDKAAAQRAASGPSAKKRSRESELPTVVKRKSQNAALAKTLSKVTGSSSTTSSRPSKSTAHSDTTSKFASPKGPTTSKLLAPRAEPSTASKTAPRPVSSTSAGSSKAVVGPPLPTKPTALASLPKSKSTPSSQKPTSSSNAPTTSRSAPAPPASPNRPSILAGLPSFRQVPSPERAATNTGRVAALTAPPSTIGKVLPQKPIAPLINGDDRSSAQPAVDELFESRVKEAVAAELDALERQKALEREQKRKEDQKKIEKHRDELADRLKATDYFARYKELFDTRPLAVACAEVIGIDSRLAVTMRGRHCVIVASATPDEDDHAGECSAMAFLLSAVGGTSPGKGEDVQAVFIHRGARLDASNEVGQLVMMMTRAHYVQVFAFGLGEPVKPIFSLGFCIVPTLSALVQEGQLASFVDTLRDYPPSAFRVHPASVVLAKRSLPPYSLGAMVDSVQSKLIAQDGLPSTSALADVAHPELLDVSELASSLPFINKNLEMEEIENYLVAMRVAYPNRYRRYVIVTDAVDEAMETDLNIDGLELMTWEELKATMAVAIF